MEDFREQIIEVSGELGKRLKEKGITFIKLPRMRDYATYILEKDKINIRVFTNANEAYFEAMKLVGYDIETQFTLADRED